MTKKLRFVFFYILFIAVFSALLGWIIIAAALIDSGVFENTPGSLYNFLTLKAPAIWHLALLLLLAVGFTAHFLLRRVEKTGKDKVAIRTVFLYILFQALAVRANFSQSLVGCAAEEVRIFTLSPL